MRMGLLDMAHLRLLTCARKMRAEYSNIRPMAEADDSTSARKGSS